MAQKLTKVSKAFRKAVRRLGRATRRSAAARLLDAARSKLSAVLASLAGASEQEAQLSEPLAYQVKALTMSPAVSQLLENWHGDLMVESGDRVRSIALTRNGVTRMHTVNKYETTVYPNGDVVTVTEVA